MPLHHLNMRPGDPDEGDLGSCLLRLWGYDQPDELWLQMNPRRNPGEPGGSATLPGNQGGSNNPTGSPHDPDNNPPHNPGEPGGSATLPGNQGGGNQGGGNDDGDDDGDSTQPQQPVGAPVGTNPGPQTPENTIPSGANPEDLPDGEYYDNDGNHIIVTTSSNGYTTVRPSGGDDDQTYFQRPDGTIGSSYDGSNTYTPPGTVNPFQSPDTSTPSFSNQDDVSYQVTAYGTVVSYQDGQAYIVSDDDLIEAVREALETGDASGLSSVDRVSVYNAAGQVVTSNYQRPTGNSAESAEAVLREFASVDEQEEWFRAQVRNLPADPAQAAQRLTELAAIAAGLGQYWSGRDAGAFVDGQGNPVAPQTYFANLSELFNASAAANQDIAQANAALPSAPADPAVGRRFEADQGAIADRLSAADAIDDPAQRAAAQAAVAADLRDLQQRWANADTTGWTFTVERGRVLTVADYWREWADGVADAAGQNRDAAERNAASQQAVADFNAAVAPGGLSPAEYARLAEQWRQRPDNLLVRIPVADPALAEGGGAVYQTPAGYFARMSGNPALIAAEEQRERERRILPGETGQIRHPGAGGPRHWHAAGVTRSDARHCPRRGGSAAAPASKPAPGETGQIGTGGRGDHRHWPTLRGRQPRQSMPAEPAALAERQSTQERALPGETGQIGTQVQVDPVTGTLQASPGVMPAVAAALAERERQERALPGETGGVGTQVAIDPVTGTLQVSPGVASALAAEAEQRAIMGEGTLAVIRGDLNEPITVEDVTRATGRIFTSREEEAGEGTTEDGAGLDAQSVRYRRSSSGGIYTPDEIRAAFPDLTDDQVKQQVALQAVLDIYNETQTTSIGSVQLTSELRRRGMDPADAGRYAKWTVDNGLGTYSDLWAVGGAVVGGFAGSYAGRFIPAFTARVSPRLTTGVLRGFAEETGEETGEIFAEVIATAASGGNPVGILLDPSTYAYAGGSILFSGVTEADAPNARPRPEAVPVGEEGTGAVFSTTGEPVDPALVTEGNRLLDRWAASNHALQNDPEDAPSGVDQATWYRRRDALQRNVGQSGDALTTFRADHPDLVVGYKAGGVNVVAIDNSLMTVSPDGQASLYAFQPGDAAFMLTSGGVDARTVFGIDDAGRLVPVRPETPGGAAATVSGGGDIPVPLGSPDADDDPVVGVDATLGSPSSAQGNLAGAATPPSLPEIAPVPTAALSEPLPLGQAEPAPQQTTPTPTETEGQGDSRDGRSAPPGVRDPGGPTFTPPPSPQPSSAAQASPASQPTPRTSPSTRPSITPTPNPDPGQGTQSQPGPSFLTTPLAQPSPGITPSTLTTPTPSPLSQPSTSPAAAAQPTVARPTPSPRPEGEPSPQPNPQPGPTPNVPTITPTTTTTPTPNPRQTPQRNRDRPDRGRRRRELPNPVADDPDAHPREVQFVDHNRHTVDLVTGEHTIEPLTDEQLRTARITDFSPEDPEGNVHQAGSLALEVNPNHIALESAVRRRDAQGARPQFGMRERTAPSAGSLDRIQPRTAAGRSGGDPSRIQPRRNPAGGAGRSAATGRIRPRDTASGGSGRSGDPSRINYRPGQQPSRAPDPTGGLMSGGGNRRRGGGRRRRNPEDEEQRNQAPQVVVQFNPS